MDRSITPHECDVFVCSIVITDVQSDAPSCELAYGFVALNPAPIPPRPPIPPAVAKLFVPAMTAPPPMALLPAITVPIAEPGLAAIPVC